ncbi:hypothetical protein C1H46_027148 [Malus baccata]|uniref:Uncharacterized protein n=1 Tax=Malus baccata TaxID=106549 RepID=A0A540LLB7_MALBA|nr:hypothetical protein C1H46_027147 [Malus baccata]TQD87281.1 hypothetical protein C1H46_027148 [Malus baccata]
MNETMMAISLHQEAVQSKMAEMQRAITSLMAMQNQFQTSWSSQQADLQRTMLEEIRQLNAAS